MTNVMPWFYCIVIAGSLAIAKSPEFIPPIRKIDSGSAVWKNLTKAQETLPAEHPLRHPDLTVVTVPTGSWASGWMYVHRVMRYISGTPEERKVASILLTSIGFGRNSLHYLCALENDAAIADNRYFATKDAAVNYLSDKNVSTAIYLEFNSSFPDSIPSEITYRGTAFRALSNRK